MSFHVGQKVVCVKEGAWRDADTFCENPGPAKGEVFEIQGFDLYRDHLFLILDRWGPDFGFNADYFRPVIDRKTDISVFLKMLDDARLKEGAA